jgi:hypothetical protein
VLLAVLTTLPLSGGLCGMLCASAPATPANHHGSHQSAADDVPAGMEIRAVSSHGCMHSGALQALSLAAERTSSNPTLALLAVTQAPATFVAVIGPASKPAWSPPPRPAPRPASLLVLRV